MLQSAVAACEEQGAGAIGPIANAAKYLTPEAAWRIADDAMQTFGGYSFAREYNIGRYWTEVLPQRTAPVNNQMVLGRRSSFNDVAGRFLHPVHPAGASWRHLERWCGTSLPSTAWPIWGFSARLVEPVS